MIAPGWQAGVYVASALLSLVLLRREAPAGEPYLATREAHGVHVVMNLGMAAMASLLWTTSGRIAVAAALVGTAALLVARLAMRRDGNKAGTGYHLIGIAAMLYGVHLMPAGMSMAMPMAMAPGWAAIALAALFAVDALATLLLGLAFPAILLRMEADAGGARRAADPRTIATLRLSAVPHIVMDLGMVAMLAPIP